MEKQRIRDLTWEMSFECDEKSDWLNTRFRLRRCSDSIEGGDLCAC